MLVSEASLKKRFTHPAARFAWAGALAGLLFGGISTQAHAGGLTVPGAAPVGQSRAGASVAKSDDPSALLYNPAGFAQIDGTQITVGVNMVDFSQKFHRAGFYEATPDNFAYEGSRFPLVEDQSSPKVGVGGLQAIPFIGVATDFGFPKLPLRFGFGLNTLQGYSERKYPRFVTVNGAQAPAPQRYDVVHQKAAPIRPSLAIAYKAHPKLDVGIRLGWGIVTVEGSRTSWSVVNYNERQRNESYFSVKNGVDWFVPSYGVGLKYRATPYLELGAEYSSEVKANAIAEGNASGGDIGLGTFEIAPVDDADAACAPGGEPGKLKACVGVSIPRRATVGARYIFRDSLGKERGDIEFDIRWENYRAIRNSSVQVDGQDTLTGQPLNRIDSRSGFRDVFSFRLGGNFDLLRGPVGLSLRGGVAHDTAAAPLGYLRLDRDGKARTTLATGVGIQLGRFSIDLGGGVVFESDATVPECKPETGGPTSDSPGCGTDGKDRPISERTGPDPLQPKLTQSRQVENPFNAGVIQSGYLLFSLGVTTRF